MKKLLPDLIAILAFVLLSFAYFFPADIENRILFQHDTAAGAVAGSYIDATSSRYKLYPININTGRIRFPPRERIYSIGS